MSAWSQLDERTFVNDEWAVAQFFNPQDGWYAINYYGGTVEGFMNPEDAMSWVEKFRANNG